ncbi:MAG: hypothetical protein WBE26_00655, partial [Phycisphaerae bacterium]
YQILEYDTVLTEIKMELKIRWDADVDLHFSIHRAESGLDEPTYERIPDVDDVVVPVVGNGVRTFYSTGTLSESVPLDVGYNYSIGVAWHSYDVWYYRDEQTYPWPFLHGQVLGSVAVNATPPLDDELDLSIFHNGAYSMQVCFVPVSGACCVPAGGGSPEGSCQLGLPSGCTAEGSWFYGERTTCNEVVCDFGACCRTCGTCDPDYTYEACVEEGGREHWSKAVCTAKLCPEITGACCDRQGVCDDEDCESQCDGTFLGEGTTCQPNMCRGACCIEGGCIDRTPEGCTGPNKWYRGNGTTCATLPPELECGGPCCYGFFDSLNYCEEVFERADCTFDWYTLSAYLGDGTQACPYDGCGHMTDYAACCLPDGLCINTTQGFCEISWVGGDFDPTGTGAACDAGTCTVGACCFPDGTCEMLTDDACTGPGFVWHTDRDCDEPDLCPIPTRACCFCDGSCENLTEAECLTHEPRGLYQDDDLPCSAVTCEGFGACCQVGGECLDDYTASECFDVFGADHYLDDCSTCEDCIDERGACCAETGACLFVLQEDCDGIGGQFHGIGIECRPDTCPKGACCLPDETCAIRAPFVCEAAGEFYQGDGTVCGPNLCVLRACCDADRNCTDTVASECTGEGDEFIPEEDCSTNPCEARGACCYRNGQCDDDKEESDCNARFEADTLCTQLSPPCLPVGACCKDGECTDRPEMECTFDDGFYVGELEECTPGLCMLGACCHLDGACEDDSVRPACTGGAYDEFYPGSSCVDVCYVRGACCVSDDPEEPCQILTQVQCADRNGIYDGNVTTCRENLCAPGACCLSDEQTCDDSLWYTRQTCERDGGVYLGPEATCDGVDCARGACCHLDGTCEDGTVALLCVGVNDNFYPGDLCGEWCVPRGACCNNETCQLLYRPDCTAGGGVYEGDAALCEPDDLCKSGACCLSEEYCDTLTRQMCERGDGIYQGAGVDCADVDCSIEIVSSDPPDCTIDARQPSEPDGSNPDGWDSIDMTFSGVASGVLPEHFTVELFPGSVDVPVVDVPVINAVNPTADPTTVTLALNVLIPPGHWTCFTHTSSSTQVCLGYLPADVNGDATAAISDILAVIDCLNDIAPCEIWQCDVDRSDVCASADILRVIDLLNGADQYNAWRDGGLDVCPSAP